MNYANFLLLKLNDCTKKIDVRKALNDERGGFTEFYIPFFEAIKKSPASFDEAIDFLVGGVDRHHSARRADEVAVELLSQAPLLLED